MKHLNWEIAGYARETAVGFVKQGFNPLLSVLLAARGAESAQDARDLTDPDRHLLTDPMAFPDMDAAVRRVRAAVANREKVAVYGDYDVDGITSSCLVAGYLRQSGLACEIYIPDRLTDGYGVKKRGIDALREKGVTLIITVDCGITAFEEVRYAAALGMDMIITDHHECAAVLPEAVAVVNPKRQDAVCGGSLAGVGVAYKLVCAVAGRENYEAVTERCCDLVAVGTVADVMPVCGENRYFIRRGLRMLQDKTRPGLGALCDAAGLEEGKISATSIGFALAPRINAAGRLGKTETALRLVLSADRKEAEALAATLCDLNRQRQAIEGEMFAQALEMLPEGGVDRPLVLAGEAWHQGIAGIVASRIAEKYNVPVVMICLAGGVGRGSCRSARGFNIYEALCRCGDLLEGFGGHEMAAGLTVREEKIELLRQRLGELYEEQREQLAEPTLRVDFEVIKPGLLTVENVAGLSALEPYGNQNPVPVLCIRNARVEEVIPLSGGKHTKFRIACFGDGYECIAFSRSAAELGVSVGKKMDVAFTPQVNEFRGRCTVQLLVSDVKMRNDGV